MSLIRSPLGGLLLQRTPPLLIRPEINVHSPLAKGLKSALLFDTPSPQTGTVSRVRDYARDLWLPNSASSMGSIVGPGGRGQRGKLADYTLVTTNAQIFFGTVIKQCSFAVIRRKVDTTARAAWLFSFKETVGNNQIVRAIAPNSDGVVYYDHYTGSAGFGRISWSGLTITTQLEYWFFHSGERGRAIWFNGKKRTESLTDVSTLTINTDYQFWINRDRHTSNSGDEQEIYQFLTWNRQLRDDEIRAWFADPYGEVFRERQGMGPPLRKNVAAAQSLAPPLLTNDQALIAPTVAAGAVTLAPPLLTNNQALIAPIVAPGAVTLAPPLLTNNQALIAPTVAAGAVTAALLLLTNDQALIAPTVAAGAVTAALPLLTNDQALIAPTVAAGAVTVALPLLTNNQALIAPIVAPGAVTLAPPLLSDPQTLFAPTVTLRLAGVLLVDAQVLFPPTVTPGAVAAALPLLTDAQTLIAPAIAGAGVTVALPLLSDPQALTAPTVAPAAVTVALPLLSDADVPIAPTLAASTDLFPPLLSDVQALFAPTVAAGAAIIVLPVLNNERILFPPSTTGGIPAKLRGGRLSRLVLGAPDPTGETYGDTTHVRSQPQ